MTKTWLPRMVFLTLLPASVWAQGIQNMDIFFMAGPSFAKTQVIGGSDVTLYGSTGYATTVGYGYQVMRRSAVSLWVEIPFLGVNPSAETASIPGSVTLGTNIFLMPGVRVMAPIQSRVSIYGAAGGGICGCTNPTLTADNPPKLSTHDTTHGMFNVGGGVDVRLNRYFSFRVDARDYITGSKLSGAPGRNHVLPTMGFVFHF